jgi:hypothetical protein
MTAGQADFIGRERETPLESSLRLEDYGTDDARRRSGRRASLEEV